MGFVDPAAPLLATCGGDTVKLFDVTVESGDPCVLAYTPAPAHPVNAVRWNHTSEYPPASPRLAPPRARSSRLRSPFPSPPPLPRSPELGLLFASFARGSLGGQPEPPGHGDPHCPGDSS
ncbi:hypothetical protein EE612_047711 [Oryza sativa]|nr:hypothetical protein EE612_047711 [Oryza sativa]